MTKKVLIVDDSQLVQQMYAAHLKEIGCEIFIAEDGIQAINTAMNELPDCILLDIQMPKINGYQVCRLLKDDSVTKDIPIIIMTSRSSGSFVADPKNWSFETGADGYFDKDSGEGLIELIQPYLEREDAEKKSDQAHVAKSDTEILAALSRLLDRQLYTDVTRLKELDERKNAFVANVSHELKSPLGIVKGFLNNVRDGICGPVNEEQKESLDICNTTVDRITRLVFDLLDLAKIEAGKIKLNEEEVKLNQLLGSVLEGFSLEIKHRNIQIKQEIDYDLPVVIGDSDRLTQVVVNLMSNALKFTPDGGEIICRAMTEDEHVRFEIEDSGPGMPREVLEKIFDKFESIAAGKRKGTGLGLAIAKDMIDLHKGQLWAESEEGSGAKFIFTLPKDLNGEGSSDE